MVLSRQQFVWLQNRAKEKKGLGLSKYSLTAEVPQKNPDFMFASLIKTVSCTSEMADDSQVIIH